MLEFLTNLSAVQWVLVGIGIIILLPNIFELVKKIPLPKIKTSNTTGDGALTDIVSKWECLHDACSEEGLEDACEKLEDMFPCLIKVRSQTNPKSEISEKERAN